MPEQSLTVIGNEQEFEFPASSVAVQVTVVVPNGNADPEGGVQTSAGAAVQLSLTPITNVTTAEHLPRSLQTGGMVGQLISGGVVSELHGEFTVMVKLQELELPVSSVALQVTVEMPTGKVLPDDGAQLKLAMPHGSVAEAT